MVTKQDISTLQINDIKKASVSIGIMSNSPLLMHKMLEKAKKMMENKKMQEPKEPRKVCDPLAECMDSIYYCENGLYGFPSVAFKDTMVGAARHTAGLKMTGARQLFHIDGEFVEILTPTQEYIMRHDVVKLPNKAADIRYRPEFLTWGAIITLIFDSEVIRPAQLASLLNRGGFYDGIGDWRPGKKGAFGQFEVVGEAEVKKLTKWREKALKTWAKPQGVLNSNRVTPEEYARYVQHHRMLMEDGVVPSKSVKPKKKGKRRSA